jgi:hypothetical protein
VCLAQEERLRRIQHGERSTPEIPLSVDRETDVLRPQASATVASSAASSLLSESFFRQKMDDATATIIQKLMSERDMKRASEESEPSSLGMDEGLVHGSAGDVSTVGNNSIATESPFSFSQLDHDAAEALQEEVDVRIVNRGSSVHSWLTVCLSGRFPLTTKTKRSLTCSFPCSVFPNH